MTRVLLIASVAVTVALTGVAVPQAQTPQAQALQPQTPQLQTPSPKFEVASIKASDPNAAGPLGQIPLIRPQGGGRLSAANVSLRLLIRMSYGLQEFQIVGGPAWQTSQKFDIVAKGEDGATTEQLMPMVKTLLADRFKLKTHTETREMPISTLLVARDDGRLGPNLKPSTADCASAQAQAEQRKRAEAILKGGAAAIADARPKPGEPPACGIAPFGGANGAGLRATGQTLVPVVQILTQAIGRPVYDKTGLPGRYDYELTFDPEVMLRIASQAGVNLPPGAANLPPSDNPSLLTAIREQLGLRLENDRGPVEVLVIDSAEMPMPD
jgi:uncharacterized protein (TIGR03435 family)